MSSSDSLAAIVVADLTGRITAWNAAAADCCGFAADDVLGQRVDLLIPPDYRDAHWAGFTKAMESGVCKFDRAAFHLPMLRKDGGVGVFPARFIFLVDAYGGSAGAMVVFSRAVESVAPFSPVTAG